MAENKMEALRQELNELILSEEKGSHVLLEKSRELDVLILQSIRAVYGIPARNSKTGDERMFELDDLMERLEILEKMYQAMRVVDPVAKTVLKYKERELFEMDFACYQFWKKQQACENCISMRAYNDDDTVFKIEYKDQSLFVVMAVPVNIMGKRLVVEFLNDTTGKLILEDKKFGNGASVITMVEYLNCVAVRDELTNLFNRRYINETLPVEILQASVKNQPLSVIFADLDFFKQVNDTYGHSTGDRILKELAQRLEYRVGKGPNWAARYGGEEFLICLPNTEEAAARQCADDIRADMENTEFHVDGIAVRVTCSFGVHTLCGTNACLTAEAMLELLDKRLYEAKSEGRNRVV